VFGDSAHPEIVKRSFPLLNFLYQNDRLGKERMNRVLYLAIGKHESMKINVYKIIKDLVESLRLEDLEYILDKFEDVDIDLDVLNIYR
jgi:hypothetical protein